MLSFHLGKVPVRILPSFFFVTLLINASLLETAPAKLALWAVLVLASVLVHEMGHAGTGLAFGLEPRIDLHGMGGTTSWSATRPLSATKRVAISLAGPGAGFVAGALVVLSRRLWLGDEPYSPMRVYVYESLLFVNFGWGLLNLLPMMPLDGGNALAHALNALTHGRGERPSRIVSIVTAAVCAALALRFYSWWPAFLALSFVALNVRALRELTLRARTERRGGGESSPVV